MKSFQEFISDLNNIETQQHSNNFTDISSRNNKQVIAQQVLNKLYSIAHDMSKKQSEESRCD